MENKIILVTGALGFVGKYVANYYRTVENAYVIGVGNGSCAQSEWTKWGINEWHPGAITVGNLLLYARKPDIIVHCAGGGSVGFSVQHPGVDFTRTVEATSQVLEFIRQHAPAAVLVYPSSAAVYGCAPQLPIHESEALRPMSPYGVHKQMAEELCRMYARNFQVRIAIVRLFSAYGPELRKQLLWDACVKLTQGGREFPGSGKESRDWVHAKDVARLLAIAASHAATSCPVVNGGSGHAVSVSQVVQTLKEELQALGEINFNGNQRPGDPHDLVADSCLAHKWGWSPEIPAMQGLPEYAQWFRSTF